MCVCVCVSASRCGKVLSVGHARHLDVCKGPPEPPTEEEIAAKVVETDSLQAGRPPCMTDFAHILVAALRHSNARFSKSIQ